MYIKQKPKRARMFVYFQLYGFIQYTRKSGSTNPDRNTNLSIGTEKGN